MLLRREPVYEGFRKTGEKLLCASCGHEFAGEDDVPRIDTRGPVIFTEAERPKAPRLFREAEKQRCCRYCKHYVVNPFMQWCGLHRKEVAATDLCDRFDRKPPDKTDDGKPRTE